MDELLALEEAMQSKAFSALDKLEKQGNRLGPPHTDRVRDGLFELRAGKKDITRTFFAYAKGQRIYILRTFVKKSAKTPASEIRISISRLQDFLNEN